MTAAEFARRIGIDSNRLATYEHGRAPIRYEVAASVAKAFNLNLRWIAEGIEPAKYFIYVPGSIGRQIPPRSVFSNAYKAFLKPFVERHFKEIAKYSGGELDEETLQAFEEMGLSALDDVRDLDLLSYLNRTFVQIVDDMPPDLYQPFYTEMVQACRKFWKSNSRRVNEWKKTPKIKTVPAWVEEIKKTVLTDAATSEKLGAVNHPFKKLLADLRQATSAPGEMSALAKYLGEKTGANVPLASVSRWLSGKREPGGEITLWMREWVTDSKRQK